MLNQITCSTNSLFVLFIQTTIKSRTIHTILQLWEYYPIFLMTSILTYFITNSNQWLSEINVNINKIIEVFPFRIIPNGFQNIINIILFCCFTWFICVYYILIVYFSLLNNNKGFPTPRSLRQNISQLLTKIILNFYDLLFLRYWSNYIMLVIVGISCHYLIIEKTVISGVIGVIITFISLLYISCVHYHNNTFYIMINIKNKNITQQQTDYPFDVIFTKPFDNIYIAIKIIVTIEYVYLKINGEIDEFFVFISFVHVFLYLYLVLIFGFHVQSYNSIWFYWFNKQAHIYRMFLILFGFYFLIFIFAWNRQDISGYVLIVYAFISWIWSYFTWLYYWYYIYKPLFYNHHNTIQKLIFLVTQEQTENQEGNEKKNFFEINYYINSIDWYKTFLWNHQIKCKINECLLCEGKDRLSENEPKFIKNSNIQSKDTLINLMKIYINNNSWLTNDKSDNFFNRDFNNFCYEVLIWLYYHMNKQKFKLYTYYLSWINKYTLLKNKHVLDNLRYIEIILSNPRETNINNTSFSNSYVHFALIYKVSEFNILLKKSIAQMQTFVQYPNKLKHISYFFTYSRNLFELKEYLRKIWTSYYNFEKTNSFDSYINKEDDLIGKIISNPIRYHILINRFIIELFINVKYKGFADNDMEMLEDFISIHYTSNSFLLLNNFTIFKCGKDWISFQGKDISEIFPAKFSKIGKNKLLGELDSYIEGNGRVGKFEFMIKKTATCSRIEYFSYRFKIAEQWINNSIVLVGNYETKKNILLFQQEKEGDDLNSTLQFDATLYDEESQRNSILSSKEEQDIYNNEVIKNMKLWNYNSGWNSWLLWKGEWVEILYNNNDPITFESVFTNIKIKNKQSNDAFSALKDTKKECHCEINYTQWFPWYRDKIKMLKKYLQSQFSLSKSSTNNSEQMNKNDTFISEFSSAKLELIMTKLNVLKEGDTKIIPVILSQIMELNSGSTKYYIYSLRVSRKTLIKTAIYSHNNSQSTILSSESVPHNINKSELNEKSASNTWVTDNNSMIGKTNSTKSSKNENKINIFSKAENKGKDINMMSKSFSKFSIVIVWLNSWIIILCIVFLIIQIIKINRWVTVNSLFFMFKKIRLIFANSFIALYPNYCVAKENSDDCLNPYGEYTTKVIQKNNYSPEDRFERFIISELKIKTDVLYKMYNEYKPKLYEYGDQTWIDTLFETMTYINIHQNNGVFGQSIEYISWEEAIRRYIASVYILVNSPIDFDTFPYYIITVQNNIVDFTTVQTKNFSEVELHIYLMIINFLNYSSVFSHAENLLTKKFDLDKDVNQNILIIYIVLVILFNSALFSLCFWQLMIVKLWFCSFIFQFLTSMDNPNFISFYTQKFEYLIELTTLYTKNPALIIKEIQEEETFKIKEELKNRHKTQNHNNSEDKKEKEEHDTFNAQYSQTKSTTKKDIENQLFPFNVGIILIFAFILIFWFLFSIVILWKFSSVNSVVNYIRGKWLIENSMYNNVLILHTIILLNMTEEEVKKLLNVNSTSDDGYMNWRLRELNSLTLEMFNVQDQLDDFSEWFGVFENITCSELILWIQDDVLWQSNLPLGHDFEQVRVKECERYGIAHLNELKFLYYDFNYRTSQVWNSLNRESYETWYDFIHDWEYNELIHMGLFLWRPIATYIRRAFLENTLSLKFIEYQNLLLMFLLCNILLEIFVCLIIKYCLVERWTKIYNDLKIMDSCFNLK